MRTVSGISNFLIPKVIAHVKWESIFFLPFLFVYVGCVMLSFVASCRSTFAQPG
jgi:hypothetical protein